MRCPYCDEEFYGIDDLEDHIDECEFEESRRECNRQLYERNARLKKVVPYEYI